MLKKLTHFTIISVCLAFNPAIAGLEEAVVSVQNTIQAPFTENAESNFGEQQSTTVSSATTEFPSFVDAYDIDITDDSISFQWVDTEFSQSISGPVQPNIFDRNYFVFNFPENTVITEISFDPTASNLLPGSAHPSAQLLSSNQVVTIFDEGVIRELGFNPVFNITTSIVAPVPIQPAHTGSWFDPANDGRGGFVNIAEQGEQSVLVLNWSDYNEDGSQLWLIGNSNPLEIGATSAIVPVQVTQQDENGDVIKSDWGTILIEFNSCDTGNLIIEPNSDEPSQSISLSRLTKITGLSC